jgi:hypothetical protein
MAFDERFLDCSWKGVGPKLERVTVEALVAGKTPDSTLAKKVIQTHQVAFSRRSANLSVELLKGPLLPVPTIHLFFIAHKTCFLFLLFSFFSFSIA